MMEQYPDSCIGVTDIEYDENGDIASADARYTSEDKTEEELLMMAIRHTGIRPYYTSLSDGGPELGGLML